MVVVIVMVMASPSGFLGLLLDAFVGQVGGLELLLTEAGWVVREIRCLNCSVCFDMAIRSNAIIVCFVAVCCWWC